jgi:hypothetical protein
VLASAGVVRMGCVINSVYKMFIGHTVVASYNDIECCVINTYIVARAICKGIECCIIINEINTVVQRSSSAKAAPRATIATIYRFVH